MGSSSLSEFKLKILEYVKFKDTISLFNRSDYLTMEAIILSTKLKVAKQNKEESYASILEAKIEDIFNQVKRFGRNQHALKAIEFISEFKKNLSI